MSRRHIGLQDTQLESKVANTTDVRSDHETSNQSSPMLLLLSHNISSQGYLIMRLALIVHQFYFSSHITHRCWDIHSCFGCWVVEAITAHADQIFSLGEWLFKECRKGTLLVCTDNSPSFLQELHPFWNTINWLSITCNKYQACYPDTTLLWIYINKHTSLSRLLMRKQSSACSVWNPLDMHSHKSKECV
jgi:hypothetical protein